MRTLCAFIVSVVSEPITEQWQNWKALYGKAYSDEEDFKRFENFKANVERIEMENNKGLTHKFGVNQFSDLTADEFGSQYLNGFKPDSLWGEAVKVGTHIYGGEDLPDSVDWVTAGAVNAVKDQGQCGSCWAFSTVAALEGAWQVATKKLVSLSEQQLVDCDQVDQGCNGGLMDNGFTYAKSAAMCSEESYSYEGVKGTCSTSSCTAVIPQGSVTGFVDVDSTMDALMSAVSQQVVSVAIEADKIAFQSYRSGVLSGYCGGSLDHGVACVGYGVDNGTKYWKIRNSWGESWGEQGYVRLLRGKGRTGECGLLSQPSYPTVKASNLFITV